MLGNAIVVVQLISVIEQILIASTIIIIGCA